LPLLREDAAALVGLLILPSSRPTKSLDATTVV